MRREPVRVLQVVQSLEIGGVERLQVTLARFHDRRRLELHVCSFRPIGDGAIAHQLRAAGIPLSSLHGVRLHNPAGVLRLVKLVRERRIDLLHSHLSTPNILAACAGTLASRPAIATLHNLSSLDENRSAANRYLEREALRRRMQLVIAVAPEIARDAQSSLGVDPSKLVLLPQAIDVTELDEVDPVDSIACRTELLRGHRGPLIVSIGMLAPRKGHELLVEAMPGLLEHFPDAQTAIVGRWGSNAPEVLRRIDLLRLKAHVACVGERADVAAILQAADLFVLPSTHEGVPLALMEAMAARTPVVAAEVGGVSSVLADQVTGRLVRPGDADALRQAMVEALASPERSRALAAAARAQIEAENRAEVWAERLTERYAEAAREAATPA